MFCVAGGSSLSPSSIEVRIADDGSGFGADVVELLDGSRSVRFDDNDAPTPFTECVIEVSVALLAEIDGLRVEGPWGDDTVAAKLHVVADRLLTRLTRHQLDRSLGECRVHAGAVAGDDGRAALLLGRSGSGKSTLTAHLVHSGLDLLNDEQITIYRVHGAVGAFTRPVAIKADGSGQLPPDLATRVAEPDQTALLTVQDLNPDARHRLTAQPVVSVVLGRDHVLAEPGQAVAHPSSVRLESILPAEAFSILCDNSLDLVRKPADALADLAWLAATVPTIRLVYEDADAAARAVSELLDQSPSGPESEWRVSSPDDAHDPARGDGQDPAIVAAEGTVLVEIDGEAFVYEPIERRLVALTADGLTLWRALPWCDEVSPELRAFASALADLAVVRIIDQDCGEPGL